MTASICIPAYKAASLIGETLESIATQTHQDWELVLVEDGSDDGTRGIVDAFARRVRQPVRYLRHDANRGLTTTRNTGIAAASHDWIAILDADDLWEPDHLASLIALAASGNADLIHSGSVLFEHGTGRHLEIRQPGPDDISGFPLSLFQGRYIIQPSSVLLHRPLWLRAGRFDPTFQHVEDRDMWLRCARAGGRFACTGRPTCRYRKHATAMSNDSLPMALGAARALDKHLDWDAIPLAIRRHRTARAWSNAGRLANARDPRLARGCFARSARLHPLPATLARLALATLRSTVARRTSAT